MSLGGADTQKRQPIGQRHSYEHHRPQPIFNSNGIPKTGERSEYANENKVVFTHSFSVIGTLMLKFNSHRKISLPWAKKSGEGGTPSPLFFETNRLKMELFQSDDNRAHKITFFPIFFRSFGVIIMAIRATVHNRIIGRHSNRGSTIFCHNQFFLPFG